MNKIIRTAEYICFKDAYHPVEKQLVISRYTDNFIIWPYGVISSVEGLIFGKFPAGMNTNPELLQKYIRAALKGKLVVYDAPFGH